MTQTYHLSNQTAPTAFGLNLPSLWSYLGLSHSVSTWSSESSSLYSLSAAKTLLTSAQLQTLRYSYLTKTSMGTTSMARILLARLMWMPRLSRTISTLNLLESLKSEVSSQNPQISRPLRSSSPLKSASSSNSFTIRMLRTSCQMLDQLKQLLEKEARRTR